MLTPLMLPHLQPRLCICPLVPLALALCHSPQDVAPPPFHDVDFGCLLQHDSTRCTLDRIHDHVLVFVAINESSLKQATSVLCCAVLWMARFLVSGCGFEAASKTPSVGDRSIPPPPASCTAHRDVPIPRCKCFHSVSFPGFTFSLLLCCVCCACRIFLILLLFPRCFLGQVDINKCWSNSCDLYLDFSTEPLFGNS